MKLPQIMTYEDIKIPVGYPDTFADVYPNSKAAYDALCEASWDIYYRSVRASKFFPLERFYGHSGWKNERIEDAITYVLLNNKLCILIQMPQFYMVTVEVSDDDYIYGCWFQP